MVALLSWRENVRYIVIYLKHIGNTVVCSAKRSYYRAFNALYGKVGIAASEEVIVQLLKVKYLPVLHCFLEACLLNKSDLKSLDYVLFSSFSKIPHTKSKNVVVKYMSSCYRCCK